MRILKLTTHHRHQQHGEATVTCLPIIIMDLHPTTLQPIKVVTITTNGLPVQGVVSSSSITVVRGSLLRQPTMVPLTTNMEISIQYLIEEEMGGHLLQHHIPMDAGRNHTKMKFNV